VIGQSECLIATEILLITGAAGVGKSTATWEISEELKRRGLPHALIDTDELDRVWPLPKDDINWQPLDVANLASWWSRYAELGIPRLVLAGVFLDLDAAIAWITEAIPGGEVRAVRLVVPTDELRRRVERREIGSAGTDQLRRSLSQAAFIDAHAHSDETVIDAGSLSVTELAVCACDLMGWSAESSPNG
jgi:hypothetical protein